MISKITGATPAFLGIVKRDKKDIAKEVEAINGISHTKKREMNELINKAIGQVEEKTIDGDIFTFYARTLPDKSGNQTFNINLVSAKRAFIETVRFNEEKETDPIEDLASKLDEMVDHAEQDSKTRIGKF